mmetsp:Transcript_37402/g.79793  ORF Transcript_37402/g.79793 Transcript_37402/m.79793 type:complete len:454 (+) Transcript_37402:244-1605(+)|eukprot:CAMPEP_0172563430 /NCGR_PEP_ID=MMETSP1067-20121228/100649_1 /TAXON_ID=265564 ORGANISM="Thalassiosira punctigera, Strain Tpunct2005C2" /NCGR_SAMPLE_ID=MMETSP1067 /ASSEMBLY_ACC=CAM_ASM_000444 /LENGTH=453 /DNA_ID=CAMNT_0013353877 /DNA_START=216 /DNA_END=1577 /DNA_ORIENTATION=+
MICKYSGYTWSILFGMIITGSARSIAVKLAYQSGFRAPLTITLLYLLGLSFSLLVHGIQQWSVNDYDALSTTRRNEEPKVNQDEPSLEMGTFTGDDVDVDTQRCGVANALPSKQNDSTITHSDSALTGSLSNDSTSSPVPDASDSSSPYSSIFEFYSTALTSFYDDELPKGSNHGLSRESEERIKWAHRIPFYLKPAIPAIFNLLNSALRWASLLYIDASVSEMMISGLELTLSVVAARIFRKRMVAKSRWAGVVTVAAGVVVIERANNSKHQRSDGEQDGETHVVAHDAMIGVVLIILQSLLSVLQDLGEEIFMQATDFPATMMLGMEGLWGFCIGLVIYLTIGNKLRIEDTDATLSMLRTNPKLRWWVVGLPFLFLLTGVFNIKATEATSAMTRNVWKTMRTVLVWVSALVIFYLGNNAAYGEAWHTPESFIILLGFAVMSAGIIVYYSAR